MFKTLKHWYQKATGSAFDQETKDQLETAQAPLSALEMRVKTLALERDQALAIAREQASKQVRTMRHAYAVKATGIINDTSYDVPTQRILLHELDLAKERAFASFAQSNEERNRSILSAYAAKRKTIATQQSNSSDTQPVLMLAPPVKRDTGASATLAQQGSVIPFPETYGERLMRMYAGRQQAHSRLRTGIAAAMIAFATIGGIGMYRTISDTALTAPAEAKQPAATYHEEQVDSADALAISANQLLRMATPTPTIENALARKPGDAHAPKRPAIVSYDWSAAHADRTYHPVFSISKAKRQEDRLVEKLTIGIDASDRERLHAQGYKLVVHDPKTGEVVTAALDQAATIPLLSSNLGLGSGKRAYVNVGIAKVADLGSGRSIAPIASVKYLL